MYEIAEYASKGLSNAKIAKTLNISIETVRTHLRNTYFVTGYSRAELWRLFHISKEEQALLIESTVKVIDAYDKLESEKCFSLPFQLGIRLEQLKNTLKVVGLINL
jgi:IS30 family transposase